MADFSLGLAIKGDLQKIFDDEKKLTRAAVEAATKAQTAETKPDLRAITAPVLGRGVSNAWRDRFYRNKGDANPAGFIYSKAPAIVKAFSADTVIVPKHGRFLAVPTMFNRYGRGTSSRKIWMTPEDMAKSGEAFTRPRKGGPGFLWFIPLRFNGKTGAIGLEGVKRYVKAHGGGYRKIEITAGKAIMKPHRRDLANRYFVNSAVPMFTLVPDVRLKKKIDLDAVIVRARDGFPAKLSSAYALLDQGYRP